jgi:hypothetical protein
MTNDAIAPACPSGEGRVSDDAILSAEEAA